MPEVIDAIEAPIATYYRDNYPGEVSKGDIKRALDHFGQRITPLLVPIYFGRAGYNPKTQERFIDAGPGNCFTFKPGEMHFYAGTVQPMIRPAHSYCFPDLSHIGNNHPALVNQLFDCTLLSSESDLLVVAWMVLCWMPDKKQVMLEILGTPSASMEQAHRQVKTAVDPATTTWQEDVPSNVKQFNNLALKHYLLSFNQVEALTPTQQDHIFSLMRGKQIQWQWKDKKVAAEITAQCPVMLNSTESVATTPKLADATLSVEVEEDNLQPTMPGQMTSMDPAIVAGLLLIFGYVNSQWTQMEYRKEFDHHGGLADLCRVGVLVAEYLRQDKDAFWQQFRLNQQGRREFELEESPVATAVAQALAAEPSGVLDLSVTDWKTRLEEYRPKKEDSSEKRPSEKEPSTDMWPTTPRGLGSKFNQIKPLLREFGISLTSSGQRGPRRYWRAEQTTTPVMDE
ncbi:hypothetical protein CK501_15165 [Halovibrio salipaludis]|uniref:Uncharacterized protein n=1 Tax=Halovibrio salipaludis TaxID=2032626 RepID=A0A2A2EXF9_9GAMM|nr:hypothetical protein CK501_15165 [Halovibrio salipaludis]